MRHMKLLLSKGGSLLRGEVHWVRSELVDVWKLEVLEQSSDLRLILLLEVVTVDGKRDVFVFEAHLQLLED